GRARARPLRGLNRRQRRRRRAQRIPCVVRPSIDKGGRPMRIRNMAFAALVSAAGTVQADTRATMQETLDHYSPYLGEPVQGFTFWSLHRWKLAGPEKVIVWPTVKDAWLVTVEKPCPQLEWARGIGFGSQQSHQVQVRIDHLEVGNQRCRIEEIRPIDLEAMKKPR